MSVVWTPRERTGDVEDVVRLRDLDKDPTFAEATVADAAAGPAAAHTLYL